MQFLYFAIQSLHEKPHQERNFFRRPAPILAAESKQSEIIDTDKCRLLYKLSDHINTALVTCNSGEKSFFCPTTITIHNYGNMFGYFTGDWNSTCRTTENSHLNYRAISLVGIICIKIKQPAIQFLWLVKVCQLQ